MSPDAAAPGPDDGDESATADWLAQRFAEFADEAVAGLALYRRLCRATAADPEVAGLLARAHPDQRRPNLLLAAVHDVLLAGADDPLGEWYGSVVEHPRVVGAGGDDPWPHFRRLALDEPAVAERIATRATQTNEVGRCGPLRAALVGVSTSAPGAPPPDAASPAVGGRPLGLVEVGASAGLNLLVDRYEVRYSPGGTAGPPSPVALACAVRGERTVPGIGEPLRVETRVGLDLAPVDVTDRDASRWLVACQWPEQLDRLHRVRAALGAGPRRAASGGAGRSGRRPGAARGGRTGPRAGGRVRHLGARLPARGAATGAAGRARPTGFGSRPHAGVRGAACGGAGARGPAATRRRGRPPVHGAGAGGLA